MPDAVGIIMDGNRRYARLRGIPSLEGHRRGYEKMKEVARWAWEAGVKELTVYAFSTENWNRSQEEVAYLMELLERALTDDLAELAEENRVRFIGERERLAPSLQKKMEALEARTMENRGGTLVIALSYGGRAEILHAVQRLAGSPVTETAFKDALWSAGLLEPDLIIRTGGEMRLSNFLTWGSAYSELMFTDTLWPALTKEEFLSMLEAFENRERRMGR